MRDLEGPLLLVGCGKMGGAMLAGWLERGLDPAETHVIEPNKAALGPIADQIRHHHADFSTLPAKLSPRVVVLAVKPQMMASALPGCRRFVGPSTLFLSIAAGKTIAYFERELGKGPLVRAMPNTPAAIARGISVAVANPLVSADQKDQADALLKAVGEVAWVEAEALIDPVTALSGGGPAYVFLLMEYLAEAGAAAGLPPELARRLARVTVSGAGELARRSPESVEQLRQNVTSPNGTTLEALKILMAEDGLKPLLTRAIAAATRRSRELAD
ncbi:MAG TPA: pyrroline-5-carboxylate reductase [Hypericibacter adhaerens]|jgi:pyrroline-5-carboxylate reductase|uniref:pyrroline-5-carboxylate reductase n=1 Tax=Hypericibacter adhaerens TaxID=2602016 RepID=UPI002C6A2742|nr:pyrroline-5-carboxylate reductase [Hypericibacter adhaerens]HWA42325.1 pyrroline-5-carboxylate reductase [Hypericibacter adhaerens]